MLIYVLEVRHDSPSITEGHWPYLDPLINSWAAMSKGETHPGVEEAGPNLCLVSGSNSQSSV